MIKIWLMETSQPIIIENEKNAYTEGQMYCVLKDDETVVKYPLCNVFRAEETYEPSMDEVLRECFSGQFRNKERDYVVGELGELERDS
jgi:hypothetical protein